MNLPNMYRIRQKFDDAKVEDIRERVKAELSGLTWSAIRPGDRVAITAGSRGIADIAQILGAIVEFFKSLEADPFLFPAMGSHGGATAEGQVAMSVGTGVGPRRTPDSYGCMLKTIPFFRLKVMFLTPKRAV
jgi:hypothetical protein